MTFSLDDSTANRITDAVELAREDLADLALLLGNTFSPFGSETDVAAVVADWYGTQGMAASVIPIIAGRDNVAARLPGSGGGASILFNAHLDTEVSGPDHDNLMQSLDLNRAGGSRDGDRLFGHTILNDRGCMAAMMIAGRSLLEAGTDLSGDVWLTSVAGETGASPVDEYVGLRYEGKGLGTAFLVEHGVRADFGVVAEMTGFAPVSYHCGAAYFRVVFRGRRTYTPFLTRPEHLADHPNAVAKAGAAISALEAWGADYEKANTVTTVGGTARPKAQVAAVRGGIPWRANRTSPYCALYMDVRTQPGADLTEITRSIESVVGEIDPNAEVTMFMAKSGTISEGVDDLVEAVSGAHSAVRGAEMPTVADEAWLSMWRDTNVLNDAGVPAITFGPGPRADGEGNRWIELDDLVDVAKIYAITAAAVAR